jgi:hypothetical protein
MKSYAVLAATFAGVALSQDIPMPSGDCAVSSPLYHLLLCTSTNLRLEPLH